MKADIVHPAVQYIGVARGGQRDHALPKFLVNIVILCFERRFSKQNSVIRPTSNILALTNFLALLKCLGYLRHWCSSRRTSRCIIKKYDRWDGWRYHLRQRYRSLGSLASQYTGKCGNIGWKMKQVLFDIVMKSHFLKHDVPQHRKDRNSSQKCTTGLTHRQNHNGEVVDRSWLCFFPSQAFVKCFTSRLMSADTTKCAHFLIRKGICDWKHALERLRSQEQSMKHIDATLTFNCRCN